MHKCKKRSRTFAFKYNTKNTHHINKYISTGELIVYVQLRQRKTNHFLFTISGLLFLGGRILDSSHFPVLWNIIPGILDFFRLSGALTAFCRFRGIGVALLGQVILLVVDEDELSDFGRRLSTFDLAPVGPSFLLTPMLEVIVTVGTRGLANCPPGEGCVSLGGEVNDSKFKVFRVPSELGGFMSDTRFLITDASFVKVEFLIAVNSKDESTSFFISDKFRIILAVEAGSRVICEKTLHRSGTGLDVCRGGEVFGSTSHVGCLFWRRFGSGGRANMLFRESKDRWRSSFPASKAAASFWFISVSLTIDSSSVKTSLMTLCLTDVIVGSRELNEAFLHS